MTPRFTVVVPVYNRRNEIDDLLASLVAQEGIGRGLVEVIVVEDGSTDPCGDICERYAGRDVDVRYYYKDNEGRSPARNYGMERARGEWLIFFDSDCVAPPTISRVSTALRRLRHSTASEAPMRLTSRSATRRKP